MPRIIYAVLCALWCNLSTASSVFIQSLQSLLHCSSSSTTMAEAKPDTFTLKLRNADGVETMFKLKKTTKFEKILTAYAGKMGIDASAYELKYDGENVSLTDTPDTLGMEEGESVDVLLKQTGGGSA